MTEDQEQLDIFLPEIPKPVGIPPVPEGSQDPEYIPGEPVWMNRTELFRYLGLEENKRNLERVEGLVYDLAVEVDLDGDGEIDVIDFDGAKEMLWVLEKRRTGMFPDDPRAKQKAEEMYERKRAAKKAGREQRRKSFDQRVEMRRAAKRRKK